jgi:hypothetical protein
MSKDSGGDNPAQDPSVHCGVFWVFFWGCFGTGIAERVFLEGLNRNTELNLASHVLATQPSSCP